MLLGLRVFLALNLWGAALAAHAQGIYVCVDDKGRKITSDRPIPECREKEQRELNASGSTKRIVKPPQTELEKKEEEAKKKKAEEALLYADEEKRKNRAFVQRYPNQAAHDKERNAALAQVDLVTATAQNRVDELSKERKALDGEMEFYKKDPSKAPVKLKRQMEENDKNFTAQKRFVSDQASEKARINAKFDEELARLKMIWNPPAAAAPVDAAASAPRVKR